MHQNLVDTNSHHECVVSRYEKNIRDIQEELVQTKAKLLNMQKEKVENEKEKRDVVSSALSNSKVDIQFVIENYTYGT